MNSRIDGDNKKDHVIIGPTSFDSLHDIDTTFQEEGGIQYAKISTAAIKDGRSDIRDVVSICQNHGIIPYLGGGMMEEAIESNDVSGFMSMLDRYEISTVEASNTKGVSHGKLIPILKSVREDCDRFLFEIGSKIDFDPKYERLDQWETEMSIGLDLGANEIVLEGAVTNDLGIYDRNGEPKTFLVSLLREKMKDQGFNPDKKIIIEASNIYNQMYWSVGCFGIDIKLGNILLSELGTLNKERAFVLEDSDSLEDIRECHERIKSITALAKLQCMKSGLNYKEVLLDPQFSEISPWYDDVEKLDLLNLIEVYDLNEVVLNRIDDLMGIFALLDH